MKKHLIVSKADIKIGQGNLFFFEFAASRFLRYDFISMNEKCSQQRKEQQKYDVRKIFCL